MLGIVVIIRRVDKAAVGVDPTPKETPPSIDVGIRSRNKETPADTAAHLVIWAKSRSPLSYCPSAADAKLLSELRGPLS